MKIFLNGQIIRIEVVFTWNSKNFSTSNFCFPSEPKKYLTNADEVPFLNDVLMEL